MNNKVWNLDGTNIIMNLIDAHKELNNYKAGIVSFKNRMQKLYDL